jgi:hypothetical protein
LTRTHGTRAETPSDLQAAKIAEYQRIEPCQVLAAAPIVPPGSKRGNRIFLTKERIFYRLEKFFEISGKVQDHTEKETKRRNFSTFYF